MTRVLYECDHCGERVVFDEPSHTTSWLSWIRFAGLLLCFIALGFLIGWIARGW